MNSTQPIKNTFIDSPAYIPKALENNRVIVYWQLQKDNRDGANVSSLSKWAQSLTEACSNSLSHIQLQLQQQ